VACAALVSGAAAAKVFLSCANRQGLDRDECLPGELPARPGTGGEGPVVELAVQHFAIAAEFPDGGDPIVRGLDLDHACSREDGTPTSCQKRSTAMPHKDDNRSGDNAIGWLNALDPVQTRTLLVYGTDTDPKITLLLRLRDYNGTADDDSVEGEIFTTGGVEPLTDGGPLASPSGSPTDRYTVSCEDLVACAQPITTTTTDRAAYVAGDVLVLPAIRDLKIAVPVSVVGRPAVPVLITLHDAIVVAPLVHDPRGLRIQGGLLGGRWTTADVVGSLVCVGLPIPIGLAQSQICPFADIASYATLDGTGHVCDALSSAWTFDAYQATIGDRIVPIIYKCDAGPQVGVDCP
jgi:hypothetical protein